MNELLSEEKPLYYTGIGSRQTPKFQCNIFYNLGQAFASHVQGDPVFVLRSGGAKGADTAFEQGCDSVGGEKQIFLPWKNFNNNKSPLYEIPEQAYTIAADVYGLTWSRLKQTTKNFMARNVLQILGPSLNEYSIMVLCWTSDGCISKDERTKQSGGTGQAIALASELDIPVFNFCRDNENERFKQFCKEFFLDE